MALAVALTGDIALVMVVAVCVLLVVATRRGALPLAQGFGLRTGVTTSSETAWAAAHAAAAPWLLRVVVAACLSMLLPVVGAFVVDQVYPPAAETATLLLVFAGYAVTSWHLVVAVRIADAAARATAAADSGPGAAPTAPGVERPEPSTARAPRTASRSRHRNVTVRSRA